MPLSQFPGHHRSRRSRDVTSLTAAICDIESVSRNEAALADAVEAALRALGHLEVVRDGDTVSPAPTSAAPSASSSPGTSTRCR